MILVVGSTGFLGGEICRMLAAKGEAVRGLVRATSNPERVAALKAAGVETVHGDLRQPDTLRAACMGVSKVVSTATTTVSSQPGDSIPATDHQGQLNLVKAAKAAGVEHFIYISYSKNIDPVDPCPLTVAKRNVEQAVMNSGMDYTILRPSVFMQVWLSPMLGFDYPNARANIFGDGHASISYISLGDVAQYVVECVNNPAARNTIFELGGPAALSPLEVVRTFEKINGKPFELQFVPVAALEAQRAAATDPLQVSFASLMLAQASGDIVDNSLAKQTFSFPLLSIEKYATEVLK